MKSKTGYLALLYLLFLLLLFASGSLGGVISDVVYFLAFLLPLGIALLRERLSGKGACTSLLGIGSRAAGLVAPLVIPTVVLIYFISVMTSSVIYSLFGAVNAVDLGENIWLAFLLHALLPALLEELLFRYLPLRIFGRESYPTMIVVSALFFALVHCDLFVIPYAFVAGVIFMAVDVMACSIWPSVMLHVINNAISVIMVFNFENAKVISAMWLIMAVGFAASLLVVLKKRREYKSEITKIISAEPIRLGAEVLYLAVPTLVLAIEDFVSKI